MNRLYLLRHAKSSWEDPALADHDRPLAPRGRRAAAAMAEHLRREQIAPELVLCSPARRTRQTLTQITPGLAGNAEIQIEPDLYMASAAGLVELLHEVPNAVKSVMLIGHNPGIRDLTVTLAREGPEIARARSKFPTAALATLAHDGSWRELASNSAVLVSFVTPKQLSTRRAER